MLNKNIGSVVGTTNLQQWQHVFTGAFKDCKAIEKQYKNSFKKTKVIYQFNLPNYGIQI